MGKIQIYVDVMIITCHDCEIQHQEEEPLGGVLVEWHCPHCGKRQKRENYVNEFFDQSYEG